MKKNDIINLEITAIASQGSGIGRCGGMAVFVPAACVGDVLEVKIVKVEKNCAYGRIERIIEASPDRIKPDCPAFPQCGGCDFRHMSYDAECAAKRQRVADAMKRIGGVDMDVEEYLRASDPDRYRNKAQLPYAMTKNGARFGFYAERSHRVVPCDDCLLQPEHFSNIAAAADEFFKKSGNDPYDETTGKGRIRHLFMRASETTGETVVCVVVNGNGIKDEPGFVDAVRAASDRVTGVVININREDTNVILGKKSRIAWGSDTITDRLCDMDFIISVKSFFQVNRTQAERLYKKAAEYAALSGEETLLDLYCGTGTIGLSMAHDAKQLIGVEIIPEAIENANKNAERNGVCNARFICADAAKAAAQLRAEGVAPDVIILDPPRKGCAQELIETVAQMSPDRVVYISCDPATLARDVKRFTELGYHPQRLCAADLFPRTRHVETVVMFSRKKPDRHITVKVEFGESEGKVSLYNIAKRAEAYKSKE